MDGLPRTGVSPLTRDNPGRKTRAASLLARLLSTKSRARAGSAI